MTRIQFATDQDRVNGNYLLATNSVVRRLRGQVFEIADQDLKLLDDQQIRYTLVPIPEPSDSDCAYASSRSTTQGRTWYDKTTEGN
jgi:hypothetical protein